MVGTVVICGGMGNFDLTAEARSSKEELPNRVYGILVNEWIWANYAQPIDNGMTNQNSVKRIAVVKGQFLEEENIRIRKSVINQLMLGNRFRDEFMGRNAQG